MNARDGLGTYGQVTQTPDDNEDSFVMSSPTSMGESLTAPSPEEMAKPAAAVPMIEIVAPATLMEGYRLETQVGEQVMTVIVPPGGVEKGQKFSVPMTSNAAIPGSGSGVTGVQRTKVPVGHWKDGLLDCFQYGLCHASVCTSCWCHALAAGQVISRLQLNWMGKPTNSQAEKASAFPTLFTISMAYFATKTFVALMMFSLMPTDPHEPPPDIIQPLALIDDLVNYAYFFLSVFVIRNLRSYVRSKYAIPENESCPTGCEDAWCACCCPCCSTAQMMRHTTEYETYRAECFSKTGLPDHVPALIV